MNAQLLIVGAGINGLALAVHAARRGMDVLLLESGALGGARSTQRSGALVRTHYADLGSAELAWDGLQRFERFAEIYGASAGFVPTGFAYVPEAGEEIAGRIEDLRDVGIDTRLIDREQLARIDPSIALADAEQVAYEPRSGYASPRQTCATLAAAARRAGAGVEAHRPVARLTGDGAQLVDGTVVRAEQTVLAAGAASVGLAATAGVEVPVSPTAVKLVVFERRAPAHLTVIDAPNGTYLRPDGDGATLVGRRTWTDEPLDDASDPLPEVDHGFVADAGERLARRLPAMAGAVVWPHRMRRPKMLLIQCGSSDMIQSTARSSTVTNRPQQPPSLPGRTVLWRVSFHFYQIPCNTPSSVHLTSAIRHIRPLFGDSVLTPKSIASCGGRRGQAGH